MAGLFSRRLHAVRRLGGRGRDGRRSDDHTSNARLHQLLKVVQKLASIRTRLRIHIILLVNPTCWRKTAASNVSGSRIPCQRGRYFLGKYKRENRIILGSGEFQKARESSSLTPCDRRDYDPSLIQIRHEKTLLLGSTHMRRVLSLALAVTFVIGAVDKAVRGARRAGSEPAVQALVGLQGRHDRYPEGTHQIRRGLGRARVLRGRGSRERHRLYAARGHSRESGRPGHFYRVRRRVHDRAGPLENHLSGPGQEVTRQNIEERHRGVQGGRRRDNPPGQARPRSLDRNHRQGRRRGFL